MIYHVTHDLRASLRALKTLPRWIADDLASHGVPLPSGVAENIDAMISQVAILDQMILDLREYSRAGRCKAPAQTVSILDLVSEILPDLPGNPAVSPEFDLEIAEILAPADQMKRLLHALLKNAVQHHDKPSVTISIRTVLDEDRLLLSVCDDGPGIAAEMREQAFAPMATLYRREEGAGTGLGLSIARRVVTRLGGQVSLSSREGARGLVVTINLPASCAVRSQPIQLTGTD